MSIKCIHTENLLCYVPQIPGDAVQAVEKPKKTSRFGKIRHRNKDVAHRQI